MVQQTIQKKSVRSGLKKITDLAYTTMKIAEFPVLEILAFSKQLEIT